jgi:DNA topoisomerase IB
VAVVRLRRSSPERPGWTRRRSGRGFGYLDQDGARISDPEALRRLRELAIPPAWRDVWICPFPNGHLQAVGTDDRGRRQYLYHPQWRARRDREKHEHMLDVARRLPQARRRVAQDLDRQGMPRERALATAFRLLDLGFFRVGGEVYAAENGSFGLATLRREHVRIQGDSVVFEYLAKSGQHRRVTVTDAAVLDVVRILKRRRGGGPELLAWRDATGWRDLTSEDVNVYVKEVVGSDASAKDFRTWHATVLAAVALARAPVPPRSVTAARREVTSAIRAVSERLGNTPAVCRASYVDPRVIDRYHGGTTIADVPSTPGAAGEGPGGLPDVTDEAVERAVLDLLTD